MNPMAVSGEQPAEVSFEVDLSAAKEKKRDEERGLSDQTPLRAASMDRIYLTPYFVYSSLK
jgi:hypothetical protein